jgi:hypothetical protein
MKFEVEVMENQRLPTLDVSLKSTPARWWGTHKEKINNWFQCKRLLRIRFVTEQEHRYEEKYEGFGQPKEHVDKCIGSMDISTTRRMATPFYSHIRRHSEELVHITGTTQRNC